MKMKSILTGLTALLSISCTGSYIKSTDFYDRLYSPNVCMGTSSYERDSTDNYEESRGIARLNFAKKCGGKLGAQSYELYCVKTGLNIQKKEAIAYCPSFCTIVSDEYYLNAVDLKTDLN